MRDCRDPAPQPVASPAPPAHRLRRIPTSPAAWALLATAVLVLTAACTDPAPTTRLDATPHADASDDTHDAAPEPDAAPPGADAPDADPTDTPSPDADTPDADAPDIAEDTPPDVPPAPLPDLVLNEVQCSGDEWIEVLNRSDFTATLDGWVVSDRADDPEHHHTLSGQLDPGAFALIAAEGDAPGFAFKLDCDNETVSLLDPLGALRDSVPLDGALPGDATLARLPDADGPWTAGQPTPRAPNRAWIDPRDALFDPMHLTTVEFTLSELDYALLDAFPQEYVEATMQFTDADGVPAPPQQVGLRIKGRYGSFRPLVGKSAFKVRFNWPTAEVDSFRGLRRMTLNNMVQDPSTLHEWTAYTIFRAAGVPAPRLGYTWVRVNGEDYGLYANVETVDAIALADDLNGTSHLYEGSYGQDLTWEHLYNLENDEGSAVDRRDLRDLIALVEWTEDDLFFDALAASVDWTEVLAMMAVEILIGHWDGYAPTRNNYYLHFDDLGVARLLPWGTDQTFDRWLDLHSGGGRLFERCMRSVPCRAAYDQTLIRVVTTIRDSDLLTRIPELAATLRPWNEADVRREYGLDAIDAWQAHTIDYLQQRLAAVSDLITCLEHAEDPDMDGFICDQDCGPEDPTIHPGAPDLCGDRIDQDCNGWADDAPECPDCIELPTTPHRTWICPRPRNRADARAQCATLGDAVDLAIIDSRDENDALWLEAQSTRRQLYWIGLDDQTTEGLFTWVDGTLPTTFTAWVDGEPNNAGGNEDCGHFWEAEPTWNDIPCETLMGAICEEREP